MTAPPTLQKLGGSYMLVVEQPEDLEHLEGFDEALWTATSLPIESLTCDAALLRYMDTDRNGRVRTDEIQDARKWLFRMLSDRSRLAEGSTVLRLAAIDTSHEDGIALKAAAERILTNLDKAGAEEINLEDIRDRQRIVAAGANNGDGIIPPEAIESQDLSEFARAVMDTVGSVTDANGKPGVNTELLEMFRTQAREQLEWLERVRIPPGAASSEVMVWGPDTPNAYAPLAALWEKIEEYFALSALACLDARVAGQFGLEEDLSALNLRDRAAIEERLRAAPLARPSSDETLKVDAKVNPAYREALEDLRELVLVRIAGRGGRSLNRAQWEEVKRLFTPYREWRARQDSMAVAKLGGDRLRGYLDGPLPEDLARLVQEDQAVAEELRQAQNIEKLILYQRWFMEMVNNSVSLPRFYDPDQRSMVEMGTLVMDGRRFTLNVKVTDREKHKKIAAHSHISLLYVEVTARQEEKEERFEVATAVTAGNNANLCVGKKGVFFTTDGREWDAAVVEVLPNPVSLREAVKHPFKKLAEFLARQWEKLTSSFYTDTEKGLAVGVDPAQKGPAPAASKSGAARDLMLGGGVAIAALGGVLTYLAKTVSEIGALGILKVMGIVVLVLLVSTMIAAVIKLRRRNLSMLLEACGWAVNAPMRLNARIGRLFTTVPSPREGTRRRRGDLVRALLRKVPGRGSGWAARLGGVLLAAALGAGIGLLLAGPLAPIIARALVKYLGL